MQGTQLNSANLTGASLYRAYLSNEGGGAAAAVQQAHLKNVNLAYAQLSGVDFTEANFYGDNAANGSPCATTGPDQSGFTKSCASAYNATMVGTRFPNAYVFGVDFRNANIQGVNFTNAVLAGASFSGATIGVNPSSSAATSFGAAYLQGTDLKSAKSLSSVDLTNAYLDFRPGGNLLYINLSGAVHNTFACSTPSTCMPATGQDVCVFVNYPSPTTVPADNSTMTCPDRNPGGCGTPGDPRWKSGLTIGMPPPLGPPPGWYAIPPLHACRACRREQRQGRTAP